MNDLLPYVAAGFVLYTLYKGNSVSNEEAIFFTNLDINKSKAESLKFAPYMDKIIERVNDTKASLTQLKGLYATIINFSSNLSLLGNHLKQVSSSQTISASLNVFNFALDFAVRTIANKEKVGSWNVLEYKKAIVELLKQGKSVVLVWEKNKSSFNITNNVNKFLIGTLVLLQVAVLNAMTNL